MSLSKIVTQFFSCKVLCTKLYGCKIGLRIYFVYRLPGLVYGWGRSQLSISVGAALRSELNNSKTSQSEVTAEVQPESKPAKHGGSRAKKAPRSAAVSACTKPKSRRGRKPAQVVYDSEDENDDAVTEKTTRKAKPLNQSVKWHARPVWVFFELC